MTKKLTMESNALTREEHKIEEQVGLGLTSNLEGMLKLKMQEQVKLRNRSTSHQTSNSNNSIATQSFNVRISILGMG